MASLLLFDVRNVLEIGSGAGNGTQKLSRLFPKATVFSVDVPISDASSSKFSWRARHKRQIPEFNQKMSASNVVFVESNSVFLHSMDLPMEFDLIFVDGDHTYPVVASDTMFAYNRVRVGGFLFMDNYEVVPKQHDVTHMVNWMRSRVKEEIMLLPLYLSPPKFVDLQRMAMLVKE